MVEKEYINGSQSGAKLFNFMMTARLRSLIEDKAVREGRSIAGYIRYLIEKDLKDNE